MKKGNLSRRGFIARSMAVLTAGAGLPAWYAREMLAAPAEAPKAAGLKVGAIGIGSPKSRGMAVIKSFQRFPQVNVAAVCDVDAAHLDNAAKQVGGSPAKFKDYRELLARKDIDAVMIATPDHWHAIIAIAAMKAGKDVYCEKPMTLTVAEGQAVAKVARETGKVFQVGSQQRSDARFRLACELVRNGRIGAVKTVEARIGGAPKGGPFKVEPPPAGLDWDFWLGPTAKVDYVKQRCHYEFRWWYEYSGGKMTDWGAHHLDISQWGLGKDGSGPISVETKSAEAPSTDPHSYNVHPNFEVHFGYEGGVTLKCTSGGENGVKFEGEDGKWIFVSRGAIKASDKKLLEEPLPTDAVRLYRSDNHTGNFLECVANRKPTICTAEVGHRSVTVCHLGVIALRTGKKLKWDPVAEKFDDADANTHLSRPMREPWKLEA
jgi:predicted dehydrogenase